MTYLPRALIAAARVRVQTFRASEYWAYASLHFLRWSAASDERGRETEDRRVMERNWVCLAKEDREWEKVTHSEEARGGDKGGRLGASGSELAEVGVEVEGGGKALVAMTASHMLSNA